MGQKIKQKVVNYQIKPFKINNNGLEELINLGKTK